MSNLTEEEEESETLPPPFDLDDDWYDDILPPDDGSDDDSSLPPALDSDDEKPPAVATDSESLSAPKEQTPDDGWDDDLSPPLTLDFEDEKPPAFPTGNIPNDSAPEPSLSDPDENVLSPPPIVPNEGTALPIVTDPEVLRIATESKPPEILPNCTQEEEQQQREQLPHPTSPLQSPIQQPPLQELHYLAPLMPEPSVPIETDNELDIDESVLNALEPCERAAFLEEQRKILEGIERENSKREASSAMAWAMAVEDNLQGAAAALAHASGNPGLEAQLQADAALAKRLQNVEQAGMIDFAKGKLKVRGSADTEKAMKEGKSTIVECVSCRKKVHVPQSASNMYCPFCNIVSPIERAKNATAQHGSNTRGIRRGRFRKNKQRWSKPFG